MTPIIEIAWIALTVMHVSGWQIILADIYFSSSIPTNGGVVQL
jgi:hypothetical protein